MRAHSSGEFSDCEVTYANSAVKLIIVGGGLAGGLLAWRLAEAHPELDFVLIEAGSTLGGEHTWCFLESDLSPAAMAWIRPLVSKSWASHEVRFPDDGIRSGRSAYHAVRSADFHHRVSARIGARAHLNTRVKEIKADRVVLETGETIVAPTVIDARGFIAPTLPNRVGWQKFFGIDVRLEAPHGLMNPVLMDATIEQTDGFRFMYCLPWTEDELLLEDTYYSDTRELDEESCERAIQNFAKANGWRVAAITRRERGALPIPLSDQWCEVLPRTGAAVGAGAGYFHATTGYSLAEAVRLTERLTIEMTKKPAELTEFSTESAQASIRRYQRERESAQSFYRLLNRMLFLGVKPEERYKILRHFYRLPEPLVERFYSGQTTWTDRFRILANRPPVPLASAIRCWASRRPSFPSLPEVHA